MSQPADVTRVWDEDASPTDGIIVDYVGCHVRDVEAVVAILNHPSCNLGASAYSPKSFAAADFVSDRWTFHIMKDPRSDELDVQNDPDATDVGVIMYGSITVERSEVHIAFLPAARGRPAREFCVWSLREIFRRRDLKQIFASFPAKNVFTRRLSEGLGFECVDDSGVLPNGLQRLDYVLTREGFANKQARESFSGTKNGRSRGTSSVRRT